jgi:hypothetical protein
MSSPKLVCNEAKTCSKHTRCWQRLVDRDAQLKITAVAGFSSVNAFVFEVHIIFTISVNAAPRRWFSKANSEETLAPGR